MDDSGLADLFAKGDEDGFAAVYSAFRGPVFGMAVSMLADRGLAEEAMQQAFIALWRGRTRYDPARDLAPWVFGIARKAAIDVFRRERRGPQTTGGELPEVPVEAISSERLWEAWQVRRAVDGLPADEAAVVRLSHFYQLSHSEIATQLGLPVGTVKSRSHRAHKRLASALGHLLDPQPAAASARAVPSQPGPSRAGPSPASSAQASSSEATDV